MLDNYYDDFYSVDYDHKREILGMKCYESTWDKPSCCFVYPYEMGLRILMMLSIIDLFNNTYQNVKVIRAMETNLINLLIAGL